MLDIDRITQIEDMLAADALEDDDLVGELNIAGLVGLAQVVDRLASERP
ncbi:hypothetical protein [Saccharopolyspora pogona]|nr:hypothetical protein [Saccharopolyspora pogona]